MVLKNLQMVSWKGKERKGVIKSEKKKIRDALLWGFYEDIKTLVKRKRLSAS